MTTLVLQKKGQEADGVLFGGAVMMTPALGGDYWTYRVVVVEGQAIQGFPKFGTIGIGYEVEDEDWNTNLPYTTDAKKILDHIARNKGSDLIPDEVVLQAIVMIQEAAAAGKGTEW